MRPAPERGNSWRRRLLGLLALGCVVATFHSAFASQSQTPAAELGDPPAAVATSAPETPAALRWRFNDVASRWWLLGLALVGLALLFARPRWLDRALAVLGFVAVLTYFNFGFFHFSGFIHTWDVFHYYLGAKYFPELGYQRLYECVAVADSLEPGWRPLVEARKITDLRTNELRSTAEILAQPERCTAHFSADRWQSFLRDVSWFRGRQAPTRWAEFSTDHGYNATPVWTLLGHRLTNTGPASQWQILLLTLLDPLYFLALVAVALWAFGWRGTAVALLVFATFSPCRYFWTGGSLLRWDWLFYMVAAVACARRHRPLLGGLALGYAASLRIFPALLAVGPLLALVADLGPALVNERPARWLATLGRRLATEPCRSHLRFLLGAALAAGLLVSLSLALGPGPSTYRAFAANATKHAATPLTNHLGLRMVLTYHPDEVGRKLVLKAPTEPWRLWKEARSRAWRVVWPVALVVALGFWALLARTLKHPHEPWVALALGSLLIPFVVDLTGYYYAFLLVPALLWTRHPRVGPLLLGLSAFTTFLSLAPLPFMSTWHDEQYTLISLATLLTFLACLLSCARSADSTTKPAPAG